MHTSILTGGKIPSDPKSSQDERQAEEKQSPPATRPSGFQNDPDDASNPNEVRERHLNKVDKKLEP